jgi:surface antigen
MKTITELPIKRIVYRQAKAALKRLKPLTKRSFFGAHVAVVLLLSFFIYQSSHQTSADSTPTIPRTVEADAPATIDEIASAGIASTVANTTNLLEKEIVSNQADSLSAQINLATVNENYLAKPQVIVTDTKTIRDVITYKTVEGDTVSKLAAKFNITSETIRWSNGLSGDSLTVGRDLIIPPINGVYYEVKAGDTIDSIADKFRASKEQIIFFNDIELTGIKAGSKIMIPGGSVQAVVARSTNTITGRATTGGTFAFGTEPLYGGNGYSYGYCTYYVASRIAVPRNWGNANTWAIGAAASGWIVSSRPQKGAIAQTRAGSQGHVGIVEEVSEDGTMIKFSDMNGLAGWNRVGYSDWVSASKFERYIYR